MITVRSAVKIRIGTAFAFRNEIPDVGVLIFMNLPITGGCVCGAIRYESSAEPVMMLKCHCRDCQHITGSGFVPAVVFQAESFRLTKGELSYHFTPSLAGGMHKRGYCAQCGSRLTGAERQGQPSRVVGVLAGSLDDPSLFRPQMDIFTTDAQSWDQMDPRIPKHEQYPPGK